MLLATKSSMNTTSLDTPSISSSRRVQSPQDSQRPNGLGTPSSAEPITSAVMKAEASFPSPVAASVTAPLSSIAALPTPPRSGRLQSPIGAVSEPRLQAVVKAAVPSSRVQSIDDEDDDTPLTALTTKKAAMPISSTINDDDDDVPLSLLKTKKGAAAAATSKTLATGASAAPTTRTSPKRARSGSEATTDDDEEDLPLLSLRKKHRTSRPLAADGAAKGTVSAEVEVQAAKNAVPVERTIKKARASDARAAASQKKTKLNKNKERVTIKVSAGSTERPRKKGASAVANERSALPIKLETVNKESKKKPGKRKRVKASKPSKKRKSTSKQMKAELEQLKKEYVLVSGSDALGTADDDGDGDPDDQSNQHQQHWLESTSSGEKKWTTLEHHGVLFPPEYEPLRAPLLYNNEEVWLEPEAEEVASFYAAKLSTDYVKKDRFRNNFFKDFRAVLRRVNKETYQRVKDLSKCDFSRIQAAMEQIKQQKKQVTMAERKALREQEAERVAKYTVAMVDGREEKVGNFRIEPPALFLGRGEHPLMGKVKGRIQPEDVTINIGPRARVPECPIPGRRWGKIIHNNTVTWLAFWKDTITSGVKYVFLAAGSSFKTTSDVLKFEKARRLHKHIDQIRRTYKRGLNSSDLLTQQRSVTLYLIDVLALRVGNEKGEEEADTVGVCSLRVEHVSLRTPDHVEFDFLGKDSIRYFNSVNVEPKVFELLKKFIVRKRKTDQVFDLLSPPQLNEYLRSLMDGLTGKVFRTYNASVTLDRLLQETKATESVPEKVMFYNRQNKEVAILCNHQRSLPRAHESTMSRFTERLEEAKKWLADLKGGLKKMKATGAGSVQLTQMRRPKLVVTADMDELQRAEARRVAADSPLEPHDVKVTRVSLPGQIVRQEENIAKLEANMQTKEDLKTVALGTSKQNYLDPRITVAWCKKNEVPIEKIFPKALALKFAWAMEVSEDFRFAR